MPRTEGAAVEAWLRFRLGNRRLGWRAGRPHLGEQKMVDAGLLLDDAEPFAELMTRCEALQKRANGEA